MSRCRVLILAGFTILFFAPALLRAQTTVTSRILGAITDAQGAAIAGADVRLVNLDTSRDWKTTSGQDGQYVFPDLNAGRYQVQASQKGFNTAHSEAIELGAAGTTLRVDLPLIVAGKTESVTVTATSVPLAHTDDADVNVALSSDLIKDVPIQGRNFLNYAQLAPLFNSGNNQLTWGVAQQTTLESTKALNLGGSEQMLGYYVDGVNNNDNWGGSQLANLNINAVSEVQVQTLNYSAAYTRDIGQITMSVKSGTNRLHGNVYDYFQSDVLNAIDSYTEIVDPSVQKSPYHENQFGGSLGGPIDLPHVFNGKDKAFFFVAFEGIRKSGGVPIFGYVPTQAERTGDFSAWLQEFPGDPRYIIYNPFTFNPVTQTRQPYANNIITNPSPQAEAYLSHFPLPNFTSGVPGDIRNWEGQGLNGITNNNITLRFDYNFRAADQIFVDFLRDSGEPFQAGSPVPALAVGVDGSSPLPTGNGPIHSTPLINGQWVHNFSPNLLNRFQMSYLRQHVLNWDPSTIKAYQSSANSWFCNLTQNNSVAGAGLSSFDKSQLDGLTSDQCLYSVVFGGSQYGFDDLSLGPSEYYYQYVPIWQITDDLTKIHGKHTFQFGVHYYRKDERDNDIIREIDIGTNTLNAHESASGEAYTGKGPFAADGSGWNTEAEFLTGVVTAMRQRTDNVGGDTSLWFRSPEWDLYFNDIWQITSKLTLNLGLAYVWAPQAYSVNNYWGVLDQSYPGWRLVMPGLTPGTHNPPFSSEKTDFAPRFGFAYRPIKNWIVRGGYGIFYDTAAYKYLDQMFFNAPGYGGSEYDSPTYATLNGEDPNTPYFTLANTFPAPVTLQKGTWPIPLGTDGGILAPQGDTFTIDSNTSKTPYLQYWNLQIERELGSKALISVGYVGSKGTKLPREYDLNLPPQGVYLNSADFNTARPLSADYPNRWGAIDAVHHDFNNAYHALEIEFSTKAWHNITVLSNYVWSKQTDLIYDTSAENGTNAIGGQWDPSLSHGLSDADHPQRFLANINYIVPYRTSWNSLMKAALANWQVSTIATFEEGSPNTILNGSTSSFDYMGDVPIRTCNGNLPHGQRSFLEYFDTSCFTDPVAGPNGIAVTRGNSGRNIIYGPGINNWDLALIKGFTIHEGYVLQFRAEAFNAFNHPQWASIDTVDDQLTNSQSQFGQVTGSRAPRLWQMSLRFDF
ncbi:MAG: carboxypeptidase-like regulatory domain-containing protein [Candidatus Acidiferrales bacterium]